MTKPLVTLIAGAFAFASASAVPSKVARTRAKDTLNQPDVETAMQKQKRQQTSSGDGVARFIPSFDSLTPTREAKGGQTVKLLSKPNRLAHAFTFF